MERQDNGKGIKGGKRRNGKKKKGMKSEGRDIGKLEGKKEKEWKQEERNEKR